MFWVSAFCANYPKTARSSFSTSQFRREASPLTTNPTDCMGPRSLPEYQTPLQWVTLNCISIIRPQSTYHWSPIWPWPFLNIGRRVTWRLIAARASGGIFNTYLVESLTSKEITVCWQDIVVGAWTPKSYFKFERKRRQAFQWRHHRRRRRCQHRRRRRNVERRKSGTSSSSTTTSTTTSIPTST